MLVNLAMLVGRFIHVYIYTSVLRPEEESNCVQLSELQSRLQSIDGEAALVPSVQVTYLLCHTGIAIHQDLEGGCGR